jgi:hypothetical protein
MKNKITLLIILLLVTVILGFLWILTKGNNMTPKVATQNQVPLPSQEDIVRTFFNQINEKKIPEALGMLSSAAVPDDAAKQAWTVQFYNFNKVTVTNIQKEANSNGKNLYRVDLQVQISPEFANAPIPNYGYTDGENVRWIELVKENDSWKITGIATGP